MAGTNDRSRSFPRLFALSRYASCFSIRSLLEEREPRVPQGARHDLSLRFVQRLSILNLEECKAVTPA
jgi:hypothetical protein